jgi:hypothetical protein
MKDGVWSKFAWVFTELNNRLLTDSDFNLDENNCGHSTESKIVFSSDNTVQSSSMNRSGRRNRYSSCQVGLWGFRILVEPINQEPTQIIISFQFPPSKLMNSYHEVSLYFMCQLTPALTSMLLLLSLLYFTCVLSIHSVMLFPASKYHLRGGEGEKEREKNLNQSAKSSLKRNGLNQC